MITEDAQAEIEALQAIYEDLTINHVISGSSLAIDEAVVTLSKRIFPRSCNFGKDSTSHVLNVVLEVSLDKNYPQTKPIVGLKSTFGIADNGTNLMHDIQSCIDNFEIGEPVLFVLFETVCDMLDNVGNGTCIICADELQLSSNVTHDELPKSVIAFCGHCFHTHCILRWAAMSLLRQEKTSKAKSSRESEEVELRTAEGAVKSEQMEKERTENSLTLMRSELDSILKSIALIDSKSANEAKLETLQSQLSALRLELSQQIQRGHIIENDSNKAKNAKTKKSTTTTSFEAVSKTSDSVSVLKEKIDAVENECKELQESLTLLENRNKLNLRKQTIENNIIENTQKLERIEERLQVARTNLNKHLVDVEKNQSQERPFPCPFCRSTLTSKGYNFVTERQRMEYCKLVDEYYRRAQMEENKEDGNSNNIHNLHSKETLTSLPKDVLEFARKVQAYQESLRKTLKCLHVTDSESENSEDKQCVQSNQLQSQQQTMNLKNSQNSQNSQHRKKRNPGGR